MKRIEAPCPSCGAPVVFKTGSGLVTICEFCHSAVARLDRKLEDLGKVAAIAPTASALEVGGRGRFRERPFEIVGHVQYAHPAGGVWDEWYAAFPNNKWLWLAEAQGKIYATQERHLPSEVVVPAWETLSAGQSVPLGSHGSWEVSEVNAAAVQAAEGELPYVLRPGATHRFADLTGAAGVFATLDFNSEKPRFFEGRELSLAELGLAGAPPASEPVVVAGAALNCPKCSGSLELKAPNEAQRVACPFCSALLDVNAGELKYLTTLKARKVKPHLPLGQEGTLAGVKYTIIGFLRRSVRFDREYTWDEYLLYAPRVGFRWLVHSDMHWSFVAPLVLGEIGPAGENGVAFEGRTFRLFQKAWVRVVYVLGEFYWKVESGESVIAEDYVAPPQMISIERTPAPGAMAVAKLHGRGGDMNVSHSEVQVSLGTYLPHEAVEQAFGVTNLPRGWAVAPNQPAPAPREIYYYWLAFTVLLVLIDVGLGRLFTRPVDHALCVWALALVSIVPAGAALYNHTFERRRWEDSEYNPYATDDDE